MMSVLPPFWRYRMRFGKRGTVRFISHRDLMGVFARAFRRAELPVRMSAGFNPRPRFSLPAPLSVGVEGHSEVLELDLTERLSPDELTHRLRREMPEGSEITGAELPDSSAKARVRSTTYRVLGELPPDAVERCMAASELRSTRRDGREVDIRKYLARMRRCDGGCEAEVLVGDDGTARPAELADALADGNSNLAKSLSLVRTGVTLTVP